MSQALFVLAIEYLAEALRQTPDVQGFQVGLSVHKISLFADDVILFLTHPFEFISALQTLLDNYNMILGHNINFNKN